MTFVEGSLGKVQIRLTITLHNIGKTFLSLAWGGFELSCASLGGVSFQEIARCLSWGIHVRLSWGWTWFVTRTQPHGPYYEKRSKFVLDVEGIDLQKLTKYLSVCSRQLPAGFRTLVRARFLGIEFDTCSSFW